MSDRIPTSDNRLGVWVGRLFHPYLICVPTGMLLLNEIAPLEALGWLLLTVAMILPPLLIATWIVRQRGRQLYQRTARGPIYMTFIATLLVCGVILNVLGAPLLLQACIAALLVWMPLQLAINTWVTKVSTHAAVVSGCTCGLLIAGKLSSPVLLIFMIGAVAITIWARIVTHHHTIPQVILGVLTGVIPVLIVFPVLLNG